MEIILIRHGKPTAAINPKLSSDGFKRWVRNYNVSLVDPESFYPPELADYLFGYYVVTSQLPRAIDSAKICIKKQPDLTLAELNEMAIPTFTLPIALPFKLRAYTWLLISRLCWLAGFNGQVESYKAAKIRAKTSAVYLNALAAQHEHVVAFGHGMMNKTIAKELSKLGWGSATQGKAYWSSIILNK